MSNYRSFNNGDYLANLNLLPDLESPLNAYGSTAPASNDHPKPSGTPAGSQTGLSNANASLGSSGSSSNADPSLGGLRGASNNNNDNNNGLPGHLEDDLSIFANTQFFDFDMGCSTDMAATVDDLIMEQEGLLQNGKALNAQLVHEGSQDYHNNNNSHNNYSYYPHQHHPATNRQMTSIASASSSNSPSQNNNGKYDFDSTNVVVASDSPSASASTMTSGSTQTLQSYTGAANSNPLTEDFLNFDFDALTQFSVLNSTPQYQVTSGQITNSPAVVPVQEVIRRESIRQGSTPSTIGSGSITNSTPNGTVASSIHSTPANSTRTSLSTLESIDAQIQAALSSRSSQSTRASVSSVSSAPRGNNNHYPSRKRIRQGSVDAILVEDDEQTVAKTNTSLLADEVRGRERLRDRETTNQVMAKTSISTSTSTTATTTTTNARRRRRSTRSLSEQQESDLSDPEGEAAEGGNIEAAEEDKRRRNTAASARFRVKKKLKEQQMELKTMELQEKVDNLETKIKQLEMENKWLKNLVVEKNEAREVNQLLNMKNKILGRDNNDAIHIKQEI